MDTIKVVLADDDAGMRLVVRHMLERVEGFTLVGEAAAQSAALTHAGVKEADTSYLSCRLEYDDGRLEIYFGGGYMIEEQL